MAAAFSAREALIPMVGGGTGGTVARVAADGELAGAHAAQLDRSLTELLESGLYQAGQQAKAAVRLLKLPGHLWPGRASEALHVNNPGDVIGLGAENAVSAELGLALALLMYRAQTGPRAVLASGTLGLNQGGRDVPVLPVHHLAQKLRIVVQYFSQPGAPPAPGILLVPLQDPDGVAVASRYHREVQSLRNLGIELHGVGTLADAARLVGARRLAVSPAARRMRQVLAGVVSGLAAFASLHACYNAPIPLSFATVAMENGTIAATPARYRLRSSAVELLPPCRLAGSDAPGFIVGERMAVRLRTGGARDRAAWLGGYQHMLVSISSSSGAKVLPPPTSNAIASGAETGYLIDVDAPEEETLLIWLAKRGKPFDAAALDAKLRQTLQPLRPTERINAARNLLQNAAAGVLIYSFRSISPGACL
jgi:hypothetical protein